MIHFWLLRFCNPKSGNSRVHSRDSVARDFKIRTAIRAKARFCHTSPYVACLSLKPSKQNVLPLNALTAQHKSNCVKMASNISVALKENEPELPSIPRASSSSRPALLRKRTIDSVLYNNSSDPPVFSSDDAFASLDDYAHPRPKKIYRGPWWSSSQQSAPEAQQVVPRKHGFTRNYDSGVWMGSEDGELEPETSGDVEIFYKSASQESSDSAFSASKALIKSWKSTPNAVMDPKQQKALDVVNRCVEHSDEDFDLSRMDLDELSCQVLEPMKQITRQPPPMALYASFEPKLRLYLASNSLSKLPPKLFSLQNLTTLSLRSNNISILPPSICQLIHLEELNLSSNALHYLPWELIKLVRRNLRSLQLRPNPFFEPDAAMPTAGKDHILRCLSGVQAISRLTFFGVHGEPLQHGAPSSSTYAKSIYPPSDSTRRILREQAEFRAAASDVPPLYELALRLCQRYENTGELLASLPADMPNHIVESLRQVEDVNSPGGATCSVCEKSYVTPRTEWIEWWQWLPDNVGFRVPLLRRGCTWKCVPEDYYGIVRQEAMDCGWRPMDDSTRI